MDPDTGRADDGSLPPVIHVDTDAALMSTVDGSVITEEMWGIYYKPDFHFGGIQGGASPYKVDTPVDQVQIDPYGPPRPNSSRRRNSHICGSVRLPIVRSVMKG